ncbi:MAG: copper chaperone PCu(A)C [Alphaproteobacteria bacterium]|nr:copper chaperone PCu(A)C [Alphaproteobacteria bacterium]
MKPILAPLTALAILAACSPGEPQAPAASGAEQAGPVLSYTDAFVVEPIAGRDMTMGGVQVSITGGDVRLVGASSDAIETIELHTMSMTDGKMRMRQVDGFDLNDGETLSLQRGGNHMMMFGLSPDIVSGETIDITLDFEADGKPMTLVIEADVRSVGE